MPGRPVRPLVSGDKGRHGRRLPIGRQQGAHRFRRAVLKITGVQCKTAESVAPERVHRHPVVLRAAYNKQLSDLVLDRHTGQDFLNPPVSHLILHLYDHSFLTKAQNFLSEIINFSLPFSRASASKDHVPRQSVLIDRIPFAPV